MRRSAVWLGLALAACSARRLPPGTPPPEYEPPIVGAWLVDAGADAAESAADAVSPSPAKSASASTSGAELSPDAGVR